MPHPRLRTTTAALVGAVATAAMVAVGGFSDAAAGPAAGADPSGRTAPAAVPTAKPSASLTISRVEPAIPTRSSGLTLSGRVSAATSACEVTVAINRSPLSSRSVLAAVTTSGAAARRRSNAAQTVASTTTDAASGAWQVQISAATMGLNDRVAAGVYPLLVSARCAGHTSYAATVLPWLPARAALKPSSVVMLWPVTAGPVRNLDNTWDDPALQAQLTPFGAMRTLLDAGSGAPVSWLIDPETLDTMALAAGRADSRGQTRRGLNGSTKTLAQTWLDDVTRITAQHTVFALPRSMPDASLAARSGRLIWVSRAQSTAAADANTVLGAADAVKGMVAWPCPRVARCLNRRDLALLTSGDASPLITVLPDSVAPAAGMPNWTAGALTSLPGSDAGSAVVTDGGLDALLATGDGISEPVMLRQRILGEFALISLERPNAPRTVATTIAPAVATQSALAGAVAGAQALSLAQSAGFITSTQLAALTTGHPRLTQRDLRLQQPRRADSLVQEAVRARASAAAAASLLSLESDRLMWRRQASTAAVNAISLTWRGNRGAQGAYIETFATTAAARRAGVRVVTAKRVYLGRSSGTIPFTVINTLDVPVTVYPQVTGHPFTRISLGSPPLALSLGPGERQGVPVGARILGSGAITVNFLVRGEDKHLISTPASTTVMTSAYARIAGWVVGGAFALLIVLIINNIRRQLRRRRLGGPSDGHSAVTEVEP